MQSGPKHISNYLNQSPLVQEARQRDLEEQRREEEELRNRKRLSQWVLRYYSTNLEQVK